VSTVGDVLCVVGGVVVIAAVLDSAIRTFVLPRGVSTPITRTVFLTVRFFFDSMARLAKSYEGRDRVMALYGPVALFTLVWTWVILVLAGYAAIYYGLVTVRSWRTAFELSGSSFFTLGFVVPPHDVGSFVLVFTEAAVGLGVLALLIAYLPTIYNAFSRREVAVAQLQTRAGTPPSGVELLERYHAIGWNDELPRLWARRSPSSCSSAHRTRTAPGSPRPVPCWMPPRSRSRCSPYRGRRRPVSASGRATWRCARSPTSSASSTTPTPHRTTPSASTGRSSTRCTSGSVAGVLPCVPTGSGRGATSGAGG
jgi:hypothetical protein